MLARAQRYPPGLSASVTPVATDPPYVCGAATRRWRLGTDIKSEHETD